jgi:glycerol-3-phosphate cytidylyltransferase
MEGNRIIGITCSTFDLLHTGHIIMLEECKKYCDYLICAIQVDPSVDRKQKNKPIQSLVERYIQLDAVKHVDKIIPYTSEKELELIFMSLDIDVRIIGEEYRDKDFTGRDICIRRDIKLIYNKRDHNFSTTNLRRSVYLNELNKVAEKINNANEK